MKKVLLAFILLSTTLLYAQKELSKDYSYTVSDPYEVVDGSKYYFSKNDQILTVKIDGEEVLLQKLDNKTEKIAFKSQKKYEDLPKNIQVETVLEFNNRFYFFYSSWDRDNEKEQLFVREIDFDKGEFTGNGKLLFKVNGRVTGSPRLSMGFISMGVQGKFDCLMSLDKKRMLVQYRKKPEVKGDTKSWDVIGMVAYDENLMMTSSNEIKMPYTERRMNVIDYTIDGEGNNYILAKVFHDDSNDDKQNKKDEEANYHIELFRLKNGAKEITDIIKVDVKDKFINGLSIFELPDKTMFFAGYYNKGKNYGTADGIIVFKAGKAGDIHDLATYEISVDVLNEYTSKGDRRRNNKKEAKGEAEFPNLELREVVVEDDGSIVLIGEQYFVLVETTHHANGGFSSRHTYHYNNLLVSKIDNGGQLSWIKKIPKRQRGRDGKGGMSYKRISANGFHYLMFLDNIENHNLPVDKEPVEYTDRKNGYFTSYKINDKDGAIVNSSVFNVKDVEDMKMHQFGTHRVFKLTDNSFAVEFYKKKKEDVMIRVQIN